MDIGNVLNVIKLPKLNLNLVNAICVGIGTVAELLIKQQKYFVKVATKNK
jgi:hypothetical protein